MNTLWRRTGMLSMAAVSIFLLCGDTAPASCKDSNNSSGLGKDVAIVSVALGAVIVGTIVLVHVHNKNHNLKGCVVAGPAGLELQTTDNHTYALSGDLLKLKQGDTVKIHGNKIKRAKGDTGEQTFTVEKLSKDYGACKIPPTPAPATP